MRRIFIYQFTICISSLAGVVVCALTVSCTLVVRWIGIPADAGSSFPSYMASLQALLAAAWGFQALCLPYSSACAVVEAQESGLLGWWMAGGVATWKVTLAQSFAILAAWALYLLGLVTPMGLWLLHVQGGVPWRQLIEHHMLYLLSAELLILFSSMLAVLSNTVIASLGGIGAWLVAVMAGDWMPGLLLRLPDALQSLAGPGISCRDLNCFTGPSPCSIIGLRSMGKSWAELFSMVSRT